MRSNVYVISMLMFLVAIVCVHEEAPRPSERRALRIDAVGCWSLDIGRDHREPHAELSDLPRVARLDTAPWPEIRRDVAHGFRRVSRVDPADTTIPGERERWFDNWSADSLSDSVRVLFNNGFAGAQFVLAVAAQGRSRDTAFGRYFDHGDVVPHRTKRGVARAIRTSCIPH